MLLNYTTDSIPLFLYCILLLLIAVNMAIEDANAFISKIWNYATVGTEQRLADENIEDGSVKFGNTEGEKVLNIHNEVKSIVVNMSIDDYSAVNTSSEFSGTVDTEHWWKDAVVVVMNTFVTLKLNLLDSRRHQEGAPMQIVMLNLRTQFLIGRYFLYCSIEPKLDTNNI